MVLFPILADVLRGDFDPTAIINIGIYPPPAGFFTESRNVFPFLSWKPKDGLEHDSFDVKPKFKAKYIFKTKVFDRFPQIICDKSVLVKPKGTPEFPFNPLGLAFDFELMSSF